MNLLDGDGPGLAGQPSRFRLYVAGESPRSARAIQNLKHLVDSNLMGACEIEVVDVLTSPERAERERILATPTLLRASPLPARRIMGDLSDYERVLRVIGPDLLIGPHGEA